MVSERLGAHRLSGPGTGHEVAVTHYEGAIDQDVPCSGRRARAVRQRPPRPDHTMKKTTALPPPLPLPTDPEVSLKLAREYEKRKSHLTENRNRSAAAHSPKYAI